MNQRCTIIVGDNLVAMKRLRAKFALVYMDPPFLTGERHLTRDGAHAFDDHWRGLQDYLAELSLRVETARKLLAPNGCLVVHVDPKTSHYVKVMCDRIFGIKCFTSEIIWRYRRWPAGYANFQRVHDVLLRYVRDPDVPPVFNQLYEPLAPSTLATWGNKKQRAVVRAGQRVRSSSTDVPSLGVPMGDVWDISILAPLSKERTGYPTQKPETLLERLVESLTNPGDLVLDPYMGSGTTLAVAMKLGRRAMGIDKGTEAHRATRKRLDALGVRFQERRVK